MSTIFLFFVAAIAICGCTFAASPENGVSRFQNLAAQHGEAFKTSTTCGGVIESLVGGIEYMLYEKTPARTCVWTIHTPRKGTVQIELVEDGFNRSCNGCQRIQVFNITSNYHNGNDYEGIYHINKVMRIYSEDRRIYNITGGSVIQISFMTHDKDRYQGTGFALAFKGIGPDITTGHPSQYPTYKIYDQLGASTGIVDHTGNSKSTFEFISLTLHPPPGHQVALTIEKFNGFDSLIRCAFTEYALNVQEYNNGNHPLSFRFRQCRTPSYNTTIYSPVPLVVYQHTPHHIMEGFRVSWTMV